MGADFEVGSAIEADFEAGSAMGADFEHRTRRKKQKSRALIQDTAPLKRDLQLALYRILSFVKPITSRGGRVVQ
jgi:hypothetical protein